MAALWGSDCVAVLVVTRWSSCSMREMRTALFPDLHHEGQTLCKTSEEDTERTRTDRVSSPHSSAPPLSFLRRILREALLRRTSASKSTWLLPTVFERCSATCLLWMVNARRLRCCKLPKALPVQRRKFFPRCSASFGDADMIDRRDHFHPTITQDASTPASIGEFHSTASRTRL